MFLEIILASLSFLSLLGIGLVLLRKIPILLELPEFSFPKEQIVSTIKKEIKNGIRKIPGAQRFDYELYLQKILSKVRVLTIKTESKTGNWLEWLRKRRNGHNHDNTYWEELKKAKDGK